jgi:hypothetical protein
MVLSHDFVAFIATHELYIYVAVILLRFKLFPVLCQVMSVFTVFSAFQRPRHSGLVANCNVETSNLGTECLRRQSHGILGRMQPDHQDKSTDIVWRFSGYETAKDSETS